MAETKSSKPTAAQQVKMLEARVAALEIYIKTFDRFLNNSMISNVVDQAANETLTEMAENIT